MKAELLVEIEGADVELLIKLRDELKAAVSKKIEAQLSRKAVKDANPLFTTITRNVRK